MERIGSSNAGGTVTSSTEGLASVFREALLLVLTPLVRLSLLCGLGYADFLKLTRTAFVRVASEDFGIRGRPTNISRVAAITGLSRKVVSKIRSNAKDSLWSPDNKTTPINSVVYYWRFDPEFCESPGVARPLIIDGPSSFAALVRKHTRDLPVGALKQQLLRTGMAEETASGKLLLLKNFSVPEHLDDDFVRAAAFSLRNLGETLAHNATLVASEAITLDEYKRKGRFERFAWSRRLSSEDAAAFHAWVRSAGGEFLEEAANWIAAHEITAEPLDDKSEFAGSAGVGLYFFDQNGRL